MSHHDRPRYVPVSTYRLQVHGGFPLTAARDVVPYLARLGVARGLHVAVLRRGAGQHARLRRRATTTRSTPRYGGPSAHDAFVAAVARRTGSGTSSTSCPNHMGIGTGANAWWNDVLENGPSSPSARFFDVDWTPVKAELHAKLLLPILGDQYGQRARARRAAARLQRTARSACATSSTSCRSTRARRRASTARPSSR